MDQEQFDSDPHQYLEDLLRDDIVTPERLVELFMCHMTKDDIKDMLDAEELSPRFINPEEDDGQPSWEQEWEDFGEVYSDEY